MYHTGDAAIEFLATRVTEDDPAASSHWRQYHTGFAFTGEGFEGLQGFGGHSRATFLRRAWHRVMQWPYRRMGKPFGSFRDLDAIGRTIAARQGRVYDLDMLRQSLSLAFIKEKLGGKPDSTATVCVIGDGFGSMTALLAESGSADTIVLVNLTRTLLVDLWYLRIALGDTFQERVHLATDEAGISALLAKDAKQNPSVPRIIAIQAMDHALIQLFPIDLAINIASMQEMDPEVVFEYFNDLRSASGKTADRELHFYCCNREEKRLPDGTAAIFANYPWCSHDRLIIDGLCPWHEYYYSKNPGFYHRYDGPIRHRLVALEGHGS